MEDISEIASNIRVRHISSGNQGVVVKLSLNVKGESRAVVALGWRLRPESKVMWLEYTNHSQERKASNRTGFSSLGNFLSFSDSRKEQFLASHPVYMEL